MELNGVHRGAHRDQRFGRVDVGERGVVRPEEALPAERDLASELSVSRITVRKAMDALVADGLLIRRQGAGTFVAGRVEKQFAKLSSFSEDMAARGPSAVSG